MKTNNNKTGKQIRPIFIVGSYRSGTSALTWVLGQHSNIWNIPEAFWYTRFASDLDYYYDRATSYSRAHLSVCGVPREQFIAFWAESLFEFIKLAQLSWLKKQYYFLSNENQNDQIDPPLRLLRSPDAPKQRWVDGTPENSFYIDVLLNIFPQARFIHLVRDPDDVALSLINFNVIGGSDYSINEAFEAWHRLTSAAYSSEKAFGSDVVRRFKQSDLLHKPEKTVCSMLEFAGEDFEEACLDPLKQKMNSSFEKNQAKPDKKIVTSYNKKIAKDCRIQFQELCLDTKFQPDQTIAKQIALDRKAINNARRVSI
jgi:hypothetical protein